MACSQYRHLSTLLSGHTAEDHRGTRQMAEGTIKRLTDRGFGFIDTGSDKDLFFHSSSLEGVSFDDLQEGQRVSYTEGRGQKGPQAENVKPI
jgi:CspA family cold shock protein